MTHVLVTLKQEFAAGAEGRDMAIQRLSELAGNHGGDLESGEDAIAHGIINLISGIAGLAPNDVIRQFDDHVLSKARSEILSIAPSKYSLLFLFNVSDEQSEAVQIDLRDPEARAYIEQAYIDFEPVYEPASLEQ